MSETLDMILQAKIRAAVRESIASVGLSVLRQTSMFPSAEQRIVRNGLAAESLKAA